VKIGGRRNFLSKVFVLPLLLRFAETRALSCAARGMGRNEQTRFLAGRVWSRSLRAMTRSVERCRRRRPRAAIARAGNAGFGLRPTGQAAPQRPCSRSRVEATRSHLKTILRGRFGRACGARIACSPPRIRRQPPPMTTHRVVFSLAAMTWRVDRANARGLCVTSQRHKRRAERPTSERGRGYPWGVPPRFPRAGVG
jgi:hypothetical protein